MICQLNLFRIFFTSAFVGSVLLIPLLFTHSMDMTLPEQKIVLHLDPVDRWTVFARLQELSVPCECACGQPLRVEATSPTAVLQIWSVVRHSSLSREAAIAVLETCWNMVVTV